MIAFDNEKYKRLQKKEIFERISKFGKLYIEVGGKIFDDNHASRVLPGFKPDVKMQIFCELKNDLEIIFCVNARDIISGKVRGDNNLTYGDETIRLVQAMRANNILANNVMINFYEDHDLVKEFEEKCKNANINTFKSYYIKDYPNCVDKILSKDGFGKNEHIKTTKNLVLVAAPGANSGKLQTCLSQLYNDKANGIKSGYAKYETFPVWNLPLNHLTNLAYEMATVDLQDKNMIDPFYFKKHGIKVVNYNRDIESFPILSQILNRIMGEVVYDSPTSMGVNMVGFAINNDVEVQKASYEEILRRHEKHTKMFNDKRLDKKSYKRSKLLLKKANKLAKQLKI